MIEFSTKLFVSAAKPIVNLGLNKLCLEILSNNYTDISRDKELHITNFEWNSILDVANIISSFTGAKIKPAETKDMVQRDKRNEPDEYILEYWKPEITLTEGIKEMIEYYD